MFCQICQSWRFRLVCLWKLIILFPPPKRFNNSMSLKVFASKAATSAVIVGNSSNNLEFFIDRTFRASYLAFRKLIKPFSFFVCNNGRGGLTNGLAQGLASAKSGPGYTAFICINYCIKCKEKRSRTPSSWSRGVALLHPWSYVLKRFFQIIFNLKNKICLNWKSSETYIKFDSKTETFILTQRVRSTSWHRSIHILKLFYILHETAMSCMTSLACFIRTVTFNNKSDK